MTEIGVDPELLEPQFSDDLTSKLIQQIRADILPVMSKQSKDLKTKAKNLDKSL